MKSIFLVSFFASIVPATCLAIEIRLRCGQTHAQIVDALSHQLGERHRYYDYAAGPLQPWDVEEVHLVLPAG